MSKIKQFALKVRRAQEQNGALFGYHQKRTGPALDKVLSFTSLVDLDYDVAVRLAACNWKVKPCKLLGCPVCFRKVRRRAIRDTYKLIAHACGAKLPQPEGISCVSINWPVEGLTPDNIRRNLRAFRMRLTRLWRHDLPDTFWHGWPDITLDGKLHYHLFILHPKRPRKEVLKELKRMFPEPGAVDVGFKTKLSVEENLKRWSRYLMGADKHVKRRRGRPLVDQDTPGLIANRIVMLERMRRDGLGALRLTLGFLGKWSGDVLRDWDTSVQIIMPEFSNVVATRRPRKNRTWKRTNNPFRIDREIEAVDRIGDPSCSRPCGTGEPPQWGLALAGSVLERMRARHKIIDADRVDLGIPRESTPTASITEEE